MRWRGCAASRARRHRLPARPAARPRRRPRRIAPRIASRLIAAPLRWRGRSGRRTCRLPAPAGRAPRSSPGERQPAERRRLRPSSAEPARPRPASPAGRVPGRRREPGPEARGRCRTVAGVRWRSNSRSRQCRISFGSGIFTGQTLSHLPQNVLAFGRCPALSTPISARRQHAAHRARIDPAIGVAADRRIDRAMVHAGRAADAAQHLLELGAEHARSGRCRPAPRGTRPARRGPPARRAPVENVV